VDCHLDYFAKDLKPFKLRIDFTTGIDSDITICKKFISDLSYYKFFHNQAIFFSQVRAFNKAFIRASFKVAILSSIRAGFFLDCLCH